jgi:DNA replication protein DnaC
MICPDCQNEYETVETIIGGHPFHYPLVCPKCSKERREKLERAAEQEAIKAENERILRGISFANFPPIYETMRKYEPKNSVQAKEWDYKTPLILLGSVGGGKTMWAVWQAIVGIWKYRKTARYISHSELFCRIDAAKRYQSFQDVNATIREFIECDILIIDEMDKQGYSDYLFRVVGGRYDAMKPTIFIANVNIEEFKKIVGQAIESRLTQKENPAKVLLFGSTDFRKEG